MSCTTTLELLDDYLDDALSVDIADGVRHHLEGCDDCRRELRELESLRRRVASLPRTLDPERDLWPEIERRLSEDGVVRTTFGVPRDRTPNRRPRTMRWIAAAAVVTVAVTAAYQLGRSQRPPVLVERPVASTVVAASASPDVELELQEVRDDLRARLDLRRDDLDPATLRVIDDNLALIDRAIERISNALESDPGNARLTRQLVFAYRQQIDLLRRTTEVPLEL
jgi:anti-sigma factor RsiW